MNEKNEKYLFSQKIIRKESGITLIALVITIIIMMILAGVAISALISDGGLFDKIRYSAGTYENAAQNEADMIGTFNDSFPLEAEFINLPKSISLGCTSNVIIKIPENVLLNECKWIISGSKQLQVDGSIWENANNFTANEEEIEVTPEQLGEIYIHVLLVNDAQRTISTSRIIEITKPYLSDIVNQNASNESPWVLYDTSELTTEQSITTLGTTSTFIPSNYREGWRIFNIEGEGKDAVITLVSNSVVGTLKAYGRTGYNNYGTALKQVTEFYKTDQASGTRSIAGSALTDTDLAILSSKNLLNIGKEYWINSKYTYLDIWTYAHVRYITAAGVVSNKRLAGWTSTTTKVQNSLSSGVRVLVTLKPGVEIYGGDGKSLNSAYKILDYTLLDKANPNDAVFTNLTNTFIADASGSAIIKLEDAGNSGINLSHSKWLFVQNENLSIDSSEWENAQSFNINNEKITLTGNVGDYYLYILSVDNAGNKTLTKSEKITVTQPKDNYFVDKVIKDNLVGNYVNYDISTLTETQTITTASSSTSFTPSEYTGKWQILSYEGSGSTGTVALVSNDIVGELPLYGRTDFVNFETILDTIGSYYKNDLAGNARSIKGNSLSTGDFVNLAKIKLLNIGKEYWVESKYTYLDIWNYDHVIYVTSTGSLSNKRFSGWTSTTLKLQNSQTSNVRVVIILKPQTTYLSGDGSENNPWELGI